MAIGIGDFKPPGTFRLPSIDNENLISGLLGLGGGEMSFLRNIDWGAEYLWSFRFMNTGGSTNGPAVPPPPFDKNFPAYSVSESVAIIENFTWSVAGREIKVPKGTKAKSLTIDFYDDVYGNLFTFVRKWINETILNNGNGVTPLLEAVKIVEITSLDTLRNTVTSRTFFVLPTGSFNRKYSSESNLVKYSLSLDIVGDITDQDISPSNSQFDQFLSIAKSAALTTISNSITSRTFGGLQKLF